MKPLTLTHVKKSIDQQSIINVEAMSLDAGCIHALVGDNGSGKTTLLHLISGYIHMDSGSLERFGENSSKEEWKQKLSYMPQEMQAHSFFSLKDLADLEQLAYKGWDYELFNRLVHEFDLPLKKKLDKLSVGMRKKR